MAEVNETFYHDLGWKIAKAEADIKEALLSKAVSDGEHFCSLGKEIGDAECAILTAVKDDGSMTRLNLSNAERDIQNRIHEARLESLKTNMEVSRYLADKTDAVKNRIEGFERNVDMQFQATALSIEKSVAAAALAGEVNTRTILQKLDADKLDEKNQKINELLNERCADRYGYQFGLQNQEIANMKQLLGSIEQTQKFSSKSVQFGTGNVAIPTQTANQG